MIENPVAIRPWFHFAGSPALHIIMDPRPAVQASRPYGLVINRADTRLT
jgi:hypothetical protein